MNYPCEDCSEYEREIKDLRRRVAALENATIASDKECERLRAANAQLTTKWENSEIAVDQLVFRCKQAEARVKRYMSALEQIAVRDEAGSGAHARMALAEPNETKHEKGLS